MRAKEERLHRALELGVKIPLRKLRRWPGAPADGTQFKNVPAGEVSSSVLLDGPIVWLA